MSPQPRAKRQFFECPHCSAPVAAGAKVCRECGSDAGTGWQDPAELEYASVDLPDGYRDSGDGALRDELPPARTPRWVVVTALLTALALIAAVIGAYAWF